MEHVIRRETNWPLTPLCPPCVEYCVETMRMFPTPPVLVRQNAYTTVVPLVVDVPTTCANCDARLSPKVHDVQEYAHVEHVLIGSVTATQLGPSHFQHY